MHLILGVVVRPAGFALFTGRTWARAVGVVAAVFSLFAYFSFVAAYPLWSISLIVVDVLVIYALIVDGRAMRSL